MQILPPDEDWERRVAFIRLEFPPAQREIAQALAVALAPMVGDAILRLQPEQRLGELLSHTDTGADALDITEFFLALTPNPFPITEGFARTAHARTFRELVEHVAEAGAGV